MAIQVLGLRDFRTQDGNNRKREVFFNKGWRFASVDDVFNVEKLQEIINQIPEDERYNVYFTVADCFEERAPGDKGRRLREQWAIPFDIDNLAIPEDSDGVAEADKAARVALSALGIPFEDVAVCFSGNGVQFFIKNDTPILSDDFFTMAREHYGVVCDRMQLALDQAGVQGSIDRSVFSGARLMRLPMTENRKPGKPHRMARILNGTVKTTRFDLFELSGLKKAEEGESLSDVALKNYPKPDTQAVCAGCAFLNHCKSNQSQVSEPQWYASQSILVRLDDGLQLCHTYSQEHPMYSHYETELKAEQARLSSGPRTCKNISTLWSGCKDCENYGKVASPIMIRGENFIASKDFGFRERKVVKDKVTPGVPAYEDLIRQFSIEHEYRTFKEGNQIYTYTGKYWEPMFDLHIREWMYTKVEPPPAVIEMNEFMGRLKGRNAATLDFFNSLVKGHMNFNNCVLNMDTLEMKPHSSEYGFFSCLPFDYDARAVAPKWEEFIEQIMEHDKEKIQVLKEYAGYAISGDDCWLQKALLIVGEGANGKSTFMEMLAEAVGRSAYAAVPLQNLGNAQSRYMLINKLFNYSEETSTKAMDDSSLMKMLVSGGEMEVKQLYVQPYITMNRAKLILSANEIPYSKDKTNGLYRRLVIVKFNARFEGPNKDPHIKTKLRAELPGIINSVLEAYRACVKRGWLAHAKDIDNALTEYKYNNNNALRFMTDCLDVTGNESDTITVADMYQQYTQFCEVEGEKPFIGIHFGRQVSKVLGLKSEQRKLDGKNARMYLGVKFKDGPEF